MGDAPRVFVSYSHESPDHEERVLRLANALRAKGVNCMLDQYEPVFAEGLQRWMRDQIREADFVLVVCTETYFRRHMGLERPGEGKGVIFESSLITQELYDAGYLNETIVPIYFGSQRDFVPLELRKFPSYRVDTPEGFKDLLRRLTRQPAVVKPPLGSTPDLPPRPIGTSDHPRRASEPLAAENARALDAVRTADAAALPAAAPAERRPRLIWIGVAAAAVLLGLGIAFYWHARPQPMEKLDRTLPGFMLWTAVYGREPMPAIPAAATAYREGLRHLAHFQVEGAKRSFKEVLRVEPGFLLAHAAMAEVLMRRGQYDPAADEARRAYDRRSDLPPEVRQEVEARFLAISARWSQAVAAYGKLPETLENRLALVEAEFSTGDAEGAKRTLHELRRWWLPQSPWVDLYEALAAYHAGDYWLQETAAARAAEGAARLGLDQLATRARIYLGIALYCRGNAAGALRELERANASASRTDDSVALLLVLDTTAVLNQRLGRLSDARRGYEEALATYRARGDSTGQAMQLNKLGGVTAERGDLSAARDYLDEAVKLARESGDQEEVSRALSSLGLVFRMQGRLGEAEANLKKALGIAKNLVNKRYAADAHGFLGDVKAARRDLEGALEEHRLSLELRGQEVGQATESRLALARVLLEGGRPGQAQLYAEQAQREFQAEKLQQREAEARTLLALIYLRQEGLPKAQLAVDEAKRLAEGTEEIELRIRLAIAEAQVLAEEGKADEGVRQLKPLLTETEAQGLVAIGFEVRLALGQIESVHGDRARGRELLTALIRSAGAAGFSRVAGDAAKLLPPTTAFLPSRISAPNPSLFVG